MHRGGNGRRRKGLAEIAGQQVEINCVNRVIVIEIALAGILAALAEIDGKNIEVNSVDALILVGIREQHAQVKSVISTSRRRKMAHVRDVYKQRLRVGCTGKIDSQC